MLDHSTWKILHLVGIGLLFMSIGGLSLNALAGGSKESLKGKGWKLVLISREFGIVLTLVSALGMLSGIEGWSKQGWIHAKFTLWLVIAAMGTIIVRKPQIAKGVWIALPLLLGAAAWLAGTKPF